MRSRLALAAWAALLVSALLGGAVLGYALARPTRDSLAFLLLGSFWLSQLWVERSTRRLRKGLGP